MKKLLFFLILFGIGFSTYPQTVSLSTILTYFETGDTPTETQFAVAWSNSYNAVADGLWDITGGETISLAPYSSTGLNRFYTGTSLPADTTYKLNYNGVFRVSKLVVNGETIDFGSIDSYWTDIENPYTVSLVDTTMDVSIGSGSSYGYRFFVKGESYFTDELHAVGVTVTNATGLEAFLTTDESGDLYLQDENSGPFKLSDLYSGGPWTWTTHKLYNTSYTTDTVVTGGLIGGHGRFFNVMKSAYFGDSVYFDGVLRTDANIYTTGGIYANSGLVSALQYNIAYAGQTGYITLYGKGNPGKITFTDEDYPSGITLSELISSSGYLTLSGSNLYPSATYNLALGTSNAYGFKLYVNGTSAFFGGAIFNGGATIMSGSKLYTGTNSYISESGINMVFKDAANASTHTLSELLGGFSIEQDSLHIHKANLDTAYFDDSQDKKLFSGGSNNIYFDIYGVDWMFEFEDNTYGVFNTDALMFNTLNDTLQDDATFKQVGKFYVSENDSLPYYYSGKEWFSLVDTANVIYQVENNPLEKIEVDTFFYDSQHYMTMISSADSIIEFGQRGGTGKLHILINDNATYLYGNNTSGIQIRPDILYFLVSGGTPWYLDKTGYWRSSTDSLATQAYARSFGGGGTGTPGGSTGDIQYNNGGAFGGFWGFDTDTIEANNTSAIKFGTSNRLRSISTSMIIGAQGTSYYFTANDINTGITGGPSIKKAAGSTTSPVITFYGDDDLGVSRSAANQMSFISNSAEIQRITADSSIFYKPVRFASGIKGYVDISGTPSAGQIPIWTDANTIEGKDSLKWIKASLSILSKLSNTYIGYESGQANTTGNANTSLGNNALKLVTSGASNTAIGYHAGSSLTTSGSNTLFGADAGKYINSTGAGNTYIGTDAGENTQNGGANTAIGYGAGYKNISGSGNIFLGRWAGNSYLGSYNLFIESSSDDTTKFTSLIWGDFANDSLRLNAKVRMKDSAYFDYISGNEPTFATLTETRALDSATITGADFAIKYKDYIPPFMDYYNDVQNNERWWYFGFKNGKWVTKRGMNLNNPSSLTALQAKSEMQDEWMMQLFNQDDALLERINFLEQENSSQRNIILNLQEQINFLADEIKLMKGRK